MSIKVYVTLHYIARLLFNKQKHLYINIPGAYILPVAYICIYCLCISIWSSNIRRIEAFRTRHYVLPCHY